VGARRGAQSASSTRAVRLSVEPQDDFGDYGPTIQMRYMGRGGLAQPSRETSGPEGLQAARELVEAQGGHLAVKHHGNTGTTVTVTVELPDQGTASW
jgi:hypothetical protein